MDNNGNDNDNDGSAEVVEECPHPPFYYKYFINDNVLTPPPIPIPMTESSSSTLSLQYNGIVATQLNGRKDYDDNKNYKHELNTLIEKLLVDALSLVETTGSHEPLRNFIENLEGTVNTIYTLLSEYRQHEAREHLINDMKEQLHSVKQIETTLQSLLNQYKHLKS